MTEMKAAAERMFSALAALETMLAQERRAAASAARRIEELEAELAEREAALEQLQNNAGASGDDELRARLEEESAARIAAETEAATLREEAADALDAAIDELKTLNNANG